jgi:SCP1.201-like deaminase
MALRPAGKTLSSLTGIVVMATVLWLILNFVYAPSCGRFACSMQPAWLPQAQADSESCPESIDQAAHDPDWAAGRAESIPRTDRKTTGLLYDSDGAEHWYTSGEKDDAAAEAAAVLKEVGAPASPIGTFPAASHVEVKAAAAMRRAEVKHGVLVINHPSGPCTGDLGCTTALPLVLSEGTTLTVWWPSEQGMQSQQFTGGPA